MFIVTMILQLTIQVNPCMFLIFFLPQFPWMEGGKRKAATHGSNLLHQHDIQKKKKKR